MEAVVIVVLSTYWKSTSHVCVEGCFLPVDVVIVLQHGRDEEIPMSIEQFRGLFRSVTTLILGGVLLDIR